MEPKLAALKLYLDALGISSTIDSVVDRKRIQKSVYLGQLSGVDLGYRYGWYLMGPYSTTLTRDYYQLADALSSDTTDDTPKKLRPEVAEKLARIRTLFDRPKDADLKSTDDWLELLASYHFLRVVSRYPHEKAVEVLEEQKHHLAGSIQQARRVLEGAGLIAA